MHRSGVKCEPDRRDVRGNDQLGINETRDVLISHLPGIEPTPSIIETCLLTVRINQRRRQLCCTGARAPPPRLPTISFLVHFGVNLTANYPNIG